MINKTRVRLYKKILKILKAYLILALVNDDRYAD
jgi:hypothetical protein